MLTRESLKNTFLRGIKSQNNLKIGVEWEKIGIYRETGKAIRYSGKRGVEAIFKALVREFHWKPITSGPHIIALNKKNASITLEPGGQIELSGQKARFLDENATELYLHLKELKKVSEPLGIAWLGLGLQPISALNEIEWVPKERYAIMRACLRNKGKLTHAMMKQTASIQVSLDYTSEADAVEKLRLAFGLTPIFTAMFANSPISDGKSNGFYSRRSHIWSQTAPERTGIIPNIGDPYFSFDHYVDFALKTPLLFIVRNRRWIPIPDQTFDDFLKNGFRGHAARLEDWELHLTTIFTDVRLKKYIEIRSIDCQKKELGLSAPALIKGLFYDAGIRQKAWGLVSDLSKKERARIFKEARIHGLKTRFKKQALLVTAQTLVVLAEQGLKRLVKKGLARPNESRYLKPLKKFLFQKKITPAEQLLSCWKLARNKEEKIKKLLHCAAI